jgi:BMFP domain-containing protein YqiC
VQELLKTNQTKLLGVREKLTDLHKHYKELEAQQNRDTTQVGSVVNPDQK